MKINEIYPENCLDTMSRMPDNFIDLVVTSPPYDDLKKYEGFIFEWKPIIKELFRVLKDGGAICWNVFDKRKNGNYSGTSFRQALYFQEVGFNFWQPIFWFNPGGMGGGNYGLYRSATEYVFIMTKGNLKTWAPIKVRHSYSGKIKKLQMSQHRNSEGAAIRKDRDGKKFKFKEEKVISNFWIIAAGHCHSTQGTLAYKHPASFPEPLARDLILSYSNPGDLVYDPMAGSGTTLYEAKKLERKYIGSEISQKYVDEIIKPRLAGLLPWGSA